MAQKTELVVGKRILFRRHAADGEIYEGLVRDVSPNGKFVRIGRGGPSWAEIATMTVLDALPDEDVAAPVKQQQQQQPPAESDGKNGKDGTKTPGGPGVAVSDGTPAGTPSAAQQ